MNCSLHADILQVGSEGVMGLCSELVRGAINHPSSAMPAKRQSHRPRQAQHSLCGPRVGSRPGLELRDDHIERAVRLA